MKKFLTILACSLTIGCASTKMAPRFDVPDTTPIAVAHKEVKEHAKKAQEITRDIEKDCPQAQALIERLNAEINDLLEANSRAEGALASVNKQLEQQTTKANKLADSYDKQGVQLKAKNEAIARRNKLIALFFALNLACLAWIFRKPLIGLVKTLLVA